MFKSALVGVVGLVSIYIVELSTRFCKISPQCFFLLKVPKSLLRNNRRFYGK